MVNSDEQYEMIIVVNHRGSGLTAGSLGVRYDVFCF